MNSAIAKFLERLDETGEIPNKIRLGLRKLADSNHLSDASEIEKVLGTTVETNGEAEDTGSESPTRDP